MGGIVFICSSQANVTRVMGKYTRSGFRIGHYMSYHSESALQPINKRMYFLNAWRISDYFDTKCTTIVQKEPILQKSENPQIDNILNLERVYFLMTCVMYGWLWVRGQLRMSWWVIAISCGNQSGIVLGRVPCLCTKWSAQRHSCKWPYFHKKQLSCYMYQSHRDT